MMVTQHRTSRRIPPRLAAIFASSLANACDLRSSWIDRAQDRRAWSAFDSLTRLARISAAIRRLRPRSREARRLL
jgi:hypothetical protein